MRVKAFPMYSGIGVSAPSLHRESTDSLIHVQGNQTILSIIEKFSFFQGQNYITTIQNESVRDVIYSECLLSEVPLYM